VGDHRGRAARVRAPMAAARTVIVRSVDSLIRRPESARRIARAPRTENDPASALRHPPWCGPEKPKWTFTQARLRLQRHVQRLRQRLAVSQARARSLA